MREIKFRAKALECCIKQNIALRNERIRDK